MHTIGHAILIECPGITDKSFRAIGGYRLDQEIVVVSHGGVIRAVVAVLLGMDLVHYWRLRLDNACLNIIDFNSPDWGTLVLFNDLSHLSCS